MSPNDLRILIFFTGFGVVCICLALILKMIKKSLKTRSQYKKAIKKLKSGDRKKKFHDKCVNPQVLHSYIADPTQFSEETRRIIKSHVLKCADCAFKVAGIISKIPVDELDVRVLDIFVDSDLVDITKDEDLNKPASSNDGDINLDSFGSGSGLLDLSLQADDTSLGGILDEIYQPWPPEPPKPPRSENDLDVIDIHEDKQLNASKEEAEKSKLDELEEDINLDSFGSGSELIDLKLQVDDCSLGGILDEIYAPDEPEESTEKHSKGIREVRDLEQKYTSHSNLVIFFTALALIIISLFLVTILMRDSEEMGYYLFFTMMGVFLSTVFIVDPIVKSFYGRKLEKEKQNILKEKL